MTEKIIFVPNRGPYDYSDALRFGKLRFLTEGTIKRFNTNTLYRVFVEGMDDAREGDYLLVASLPILNIIATGIMVEKFGRANLLLFNRDHYLERTIIFGSLLPEEEEDDDQESRAGAAD